MERRKNTAIKYCGFMLNGICDQDSELRGENYQIIAIPPKLQFQDAPGP